MTASELSIGRRGTVLKVAKPQQLLRPHHMQHQHPRTVMSVEYVVTTDAHFVSASYSGPESAHEELLPQIKAVLESFTLTD